MYPFIKNMSCATVSALTPPHATPRPSNCLSRKSGKSGKIWENIGNCIGRYSKIGDFPQFSLGTKIISMIRPSA